MVMSEASRILALAYLHGTYLAESGMLIERVVYVNCERKRTPKVSEGADFLWWGTFEVLSNENIRAMLETTVFSGLF